MNCSDGNSVSIKSTRKVKASAEKWIKKIYFFVFNNNKKILPNLTT